MRRIVQTSRGWIDVELVPSGWHSATWYGGVALVVLLALWAL
jgi:hypothetical protein